MEEKLEIILTALRGDLAVAELCRKHGISDATYYKWRSQFFEVRYSTTAYRLTFTSVSNRAILNESAPE